jgi:hypothetical protein
LFVAIGIAATAAANSLQQEPARPTRGFTYLNDKDPTVPWSVHVVKVERAHAGIGLCTTFGNGDVLGMRTVSEQVKLLPPEAGLPVAAVNGDFYTSSANYLGRPRNIQIRLGELVSGPSGHTAFWLDAAGNPHMTNVQSRFRVLWPDGTATPFGLNEERGSGAAVLYTSVIGTSTRTRGGLEVILERGTNTAWLPLQAGQTYVAQVREVHAAGDSPIDRDTLVLSLGSKLASTIAAPTPGAALKIVTETFPDLRGAQTALGGGPTLVRDGKVQKWSGLQLRHPRSAIGWNKEHIFLVEVDGRQSALSVGMAFPELAAYMAKLGCEQAMNLDGGGSATFWVLGNVMNSPSEGRERPAANALVVVEKRPKVVTPGPESSAACIASIRPTGPYAWRRCCWSAPPL